MSDTKQYHSFFNEITHTINSARFEAYKSLNRSHIGLNFIIGKLIAKNQDINNWGKSIVDTLSKDTNKHINGIKGYSPQNLWRMRQFHLEYKDEKELLDLATKIPWGQISLIMQQIKNYEERKYYLTTTDKLAWSRSVFLNQIKVNANQIHFPILKQHNFESVLSAHLSEKANEALKSKYNLDFLGINKPVLERGLANRLVEKIRDFLLELGNGFSFIDNQYCLKLKQKEYLLTCNSTTDF